MKKGIFTILFYLVFQTACFAQTHQELLEQGIKLFKGKQYHQAIETLSTLIDMAPDNVGAYRIRGSSQMMLEQFDKAINDFENAVRIAPEAFGVHSDLGAAWYSKKEYEKALEYYNLEVDKAQDNHLLFFNRALCFEQLNNPDLAIKDLNTSLEMKPDFYWAVCYKANLLVEKNQTDQAIELYEKAIRIDPEKKYAHKKLAELKKDMPAPAEPAITAPPKKTIKPKEGKTTYAVQSGAFKNKDNAQKMKQKLGKNGFDSRVLTLTDNKNELWYLVRTGSYPDKETALKTADMLKEKLGIKTLIRPESSW